MNKFDKAYAECDELMSEGKFKSMAVATMLGLGVAGGVDGSELKHYNPKPYTLTREHSDSEIHKLAMPMIERGEGFEQYAYEDTELVMTIGYGTSLEERHNIKQLTQLGYNVPDLLSGKTPITKEDARIMLESGFNYALSDARKFLPNFDTQPILVKAILVDMAYNLGYPKLSDFKNFRGALIAHDYINAGVEMEDSKWFKQVKSRSERHLKRMNAIAKSHGQR